MGISKAEREIIFKSTAFDLINLIQNDDSLEEEAKRKVTELIKDYVRKTISVKDIR